MATIGQQNTEKNGNFTSNIARSDQTMVDKEKGEPETTEESCIEKLFIEYDIQVDPWAEEEPEYCEEDMSDDDTACGYFPTEEEIIASIMGSDLSNKEADRKEK